MIKKIILLSFMSCISAVQAQNMLATTEKVVSLDNKFVQNLMSRANNACSRKDGKALIQLFSSEIQKKFKEKNMYLDREPQFTEYCKNFAELRVAYPQNTKFCTRLIRGSVRLCTYTQSLNDATKGGPRVIFENNMLKFNEF